MPDQLTCHTFDSLDTSWEDLLCQSEMDTIFLTSGWQRLWWEHFGSEADLLLLSFHDGDDHIGIAPLQRRDDEIAFLGDTDLFDYHDFIVPSGAEGRFYPMLVDRLARESWERLHFVSLPEGSPTLARLPGLASERGWTCAVEQEDVSPGVALPSGWDEYLSLLTKKHRHELRRKFRRLQGATGVKTEACTSAEAVDARMEEFFALMRLSREDKGRFLTAEREGFFRTMAVGLAAQGLAHLWFLEVEGRAVAATLCFDYGNRRLLYNSGFDPEFGDLSVGLLLKATCIRDAIDRGMSYFDFLRGDEPYKYHLGGSDRPIYRMTVTR